MFVERKSTPHWPNWMPGCVLIWLLFCSLAAGCATRDRTKNELPKETPALSATARTARPVSPIVSDGQVLLGDGVGPEDLKKFFHLAEGSEFVPYCALETYAKEHGLTVAQYFERYHLIPDARSPMNPLGLPIGVTADSLKLVGFNCAACHVGKITQGSASYIVVGGPANFNIRLLYDELIPWLSELPKNGKSLRKVAGCMLLGSTIESSALSDEDKLATNEVRDELRVTLEQSDGDHGAANDVYAHLDAAANSTASQDRATDELDQAAESTAASSNRLKALPKEKRRHLVQALRQEFEKQKGLLKARIQSLKITQAVGSLRYTTPGPGRVDAFMTALNLMNPGTAQREAASLAMDSPVAFPQLWGVANLTWLHWDNNTNATLQRNMGQAIGLGALIAPDTKDPAKVIGTTLKVRALLELERIMREITSPPWPFAKDEALRTAGQAVYEKNCARCHTPNANGSMPELPVSEDPGTDERRVSNFKNEKYGKKLIDLLKDQLATVEAASGANEAERDRAPQWVATGKYGARTLRGVWATAPYLHNNSVPTLADLLTVPNERPKKFTLDYSRYDPERVGFAIEDKVNEGAVEFDTSQPGNGNGGHLYGTDLSGADKRSLLVFLKQY